MNFDETACVENDRTVGIFDLALVYFPHLIAALIAVLICIGGYFKDRKSLIISNIIVLWGPIEFIALIS